MKPRASGAEKLIEDVAEAVRPRLRGWLHLGTFPLAAVAGTLLVLMAPDGRTRTATGIFALTSALLFGVSALYHRGHWSPRAMKLLKRLDHSNIYLLVAGTYTPFAVLALPKGERVVLLSVVWCGAAGGGLFRMLRPDAPRWLYVPLYAVLGWVAVFFMPSLVAGAGTLAMGLIVAGGLLYTAGAVMYGLQRPATWPGTWGHHEWFHAATVAAWAVHYAAIAVVVESAA